MKNVFTMQAENAFGANPSFEGDCFITKTVGAAQRRTLNDLDRKLQSQLEALTLPPALTVIKYFTLALGLLIIAVILNLDVGIAESFQKLPYLYFASVALLLVAITIKIVEVVKRNKYIHSEQFHTQIEESEKAVEKSKKALGIPEDARSVDVLSFFFKDKDGERVSIGKFDYIPLDTYMYADEACFYLADDTRVYTFSRADITKFEKITKKITINDWNKTDGIHSKKYKSYKLSETSSGFIRVGGYYSLQMDTEHGQYALYFPVYEEKNIRDLLGFN